LVRMRKWPRPNLRYYPSMQLGRTEENQSR
jgi:hypothetical protein